MRNKPCKPASVEQQHSAETLIAIITSLPPKERLKVIDFANRSPDNDAISEVLNALVFLLKLLDKVLKSIDAGNLKGTEDLIRNQLTEQNADELLGQLRQKVETLQRKRGMTPKNKETLERYQRYLKECPKQIIALHRLLEGCNRISAGRVGWLGKLG